MMVAYEKLIKETESPGTLYMFAEQDYYYSAYHALDLEGIDYNKKTVEIYNEDAYQLLNRTLNIPRVSELGYARSAYNDFFFEPSVDLMFADRNSITTYLMYDDLKYTAPIPFSNASGEAIFYPQESAVISNSCTEKDTAWEFLKFFLGYDDARADTDFSVSNLYRSYPVQREMFRKYTEKIFSNLYDRNIVEHTIPYSKDEAIERAVAACEKNMDQASRRVIMNEKPYRDIWMPYISECIGNSSSSIPELMKGLESDIREMLTGRK